MASGWGGAWGGCQGGREFSPTASLANLPGFTSEDGVQGGRSRDRSNPQETPKCADSREASSAPSLPESSEKRPGTGSRRVTRSGAGTGKITVRVPTEPLPLTPTVCRELLAILVELTAVENLDACARRGAQ